MAEEEFNKRIYSTNQLKIFISWILRLFLVFSIIWEFNEGRWTVFVINILALFVTFMPFLLKKLFTIKLPFGFEFLFYLSILLSVIFEKLLTGVFVQLFLGVFFGFIGLVLMFVLYYNSSVKTSYGLIAFFSFCFSVSLGAVWEVFRYLLHLFFELNFGVFNVSYTPQTLIFTMIGALFSSSAGLLYLKYSKGVLFHRFIKSFMKINPRLFDNYSNSAQYIRNLIEDGENEKVEFKSTFRTNLHTNKHDKKMEHSVLKTITAFLNSQGGTLLVGVTDDGEIIGLEKDGFGSKDMFYRHFTNLVKTRIGNQFMPYINTNIVKVDGHEVLKIECTKSKREVFLKNAEKEGFFIRAGPTSVKLEGKEMLQYVNRKFKK